MSPLHPAMTFLPAFFAFAVLPVLSLGPAQSGVALSSLRHDYRPLLVFAAADNQSLWEQINLLSGQIAGLQERQMLIVPIVLDRYQDEIWKTMLPEGCSAHFMPEEETAARKRFHIGNDEFAVVLIGKDGGEKLRSSTPVTIERLIKVIDSMPMRQKEARNGHSG
jgi:hypothetical protein